MEYLARLLMHKILTGNRASDCVNASHPAPFEFALTFNGCSCIMYLKNIQSGGGTSGGQMDKPPGHSRANAKARSGC